METNAVENVVCAEINARFQMNTNISDVFPIGLHLQGRPLSKASLSGWSKDKRDNSLFHA
jgi:hypothetical protein